MASSLTLVVTGPDLVTHTATFNFPTAVTLRLLAAYHTILEAGGTPQTDAQIISGIFQQMCASVLFGMRNKEVEIAQAATAPPALVPVPTPTMS